MRRWLRGRDLGFKLGTGFFAAFLVVIVLGIGFELWRQSMLSIEKFGFGFWLGEIWDPVSGEFGARPFIWGTLYSSVLALLLAGPIALGIAIYLSELCPARLRTPLTFLTELLAAIPSIVYGLWGIFVLVPVGPQPRAVVPGVSPRHAAVQRSRGRRRHAGRGADPGDHGHPVRVLGGP